jgi:hypothetical protein
MIFAASVTEACMHGKTNLTIQDYFRRSGAYRRDTPRVCGHRSTTEKWTTAFSRALAAAQSDSKPDTPGLTIRDYIARPLIAKTRLNPFASEPQRDRLHDTPNPDPLKDTEAMEAPSDDDKTMPAPLPDKPPGRPAIEKGRIMASINKAARKYQLPKRLLQAVVRAESDFQVRAVSPAGAQGLMQLMPATARDLGVEDPFDIDQNIDGGAKYLRSMLDQFGGDLKLALSAYNAGPGNVIKFKGQVPFSETRAYIDRVMRFAGRYA